MKNEKSKWKLFINLVILMLFCIIGPLQLAADYSYSPQTIIASWNGQGVWLYECLTNQWTKLSDHEATCLAAGDFDGDRAEDLLGFYKDGVGVWIRYSGNEIWEKQTVDLTLLKWIASADLNNDSRDDLITGGDNGVWWRDSQNQNWQKLSNYASLTGAAGDCNGDGLDDLAVFFSTEMGVWIRDSQTAIWSKQIVDTRGFKSLAIGNMNRDAKEDLLYSCDSGAWWRDSQTLEWHLILSEPALTMTSADLDLDGLDDLIFSSANERQPGMWVRYSSERSPQQLSEKTAASITGLLPHLFNNGLGLFSKFPFHSCFADIRREWNTCSNDSFWDCPAAKGFTANRVRVPLEKEFSVMTWNVAGLDGYPSELYDYVLSLAPDIFGFQEGFTDSLQNFLMGTGLYPWIQLPRMKESGSYICDVDDNSAEWVDIYTLHADAGTFDGDENARHAQIGQLISFVKWYSWRNSVIIMGDFNFHWDDFDEGLQNLIIKDLGMTMCKTGSTHPQLKEPFDRIFYRSKKNILELKSCSVLPVPDYYYTWVDDLGDEHACAEPLSDHLPIMAKFIARPCPDYYIEDISFTPETAKIGDLIGISIKVKNGSNTSSGGFGIMLKSESQNVIGNKYFEAGFTGSQTITFQSFKVINEIHEFAAIADFDQAIPEADETNNTLTKQFQFTDSTVNPTAPVLTSPENNAVLISLTPTLKWNPVTANPAVSQYGIEIYSSTGSCVYQKEIGNVTSHRVSSGILKEQNSYKCRIRAYNGEWGVWSAYRNFSISEAQVSIDLGGMNTFNGITYPSVKPLDGETEPASAKTSTHPFIDLRRNQGLNGDAGGEDRYFYFCIDDSFIYNGDHQDVEVTVEYWDNQQDALSTENTFWVEYDSISGGAYKATAEKIVSTTEEMRAAKFTIPDARFGNRQTSGADLRICCGPNGSNARRYINVVRVKKL